MKEMYKSPSLSSSGSGSHRGTVPKVEQTRPDLWPELEGKVSQPLVVDKWFQVAFPDVTEKYAGIEMPTNFDTDLKDKVEQVPLGSKKRRESDMYPKLSDCMNWISETAVKACETAAEGKQKRCEEAPTGADVKPLLREEDSKSSSANTKPDHATCGKVSRPSDSQGSSKMNSVEFVVTASGKPSQAESIADSIPSMTPDLVAYAGDGPSGLKRWLWSSLFVEAKYKSSENPMRPNGDKRLKDGPLKPGKAGRKFLQECDYARAMFHAQPRCFLLGMGIYGSVVRFYRFDRTGIVVSENVDWTQQPEVLADFIIRFGSVSRTGRGFDPTSTPVTDPIEISLIAGLREKVIRDRLTVESDDFIERSVRLWVPSKTRHNEGDVFLSIGPPLMASTSLLGRGTHTWLVIKVNESPEQQGRFYIIKDSWRNSTRKSEGEMYTRIYTKDSVEGGLKPNPEAKAAGHVFGIARMDRDVDLQFNGDDVLHRTRSQLQEGLEDCMIRLQHRVLLLSVGIHLTRFISTREMTGAVLDATYGHQGMCDRRVLHRDMSVDNIMISYDPLAEYGARGFIIDPEYAADLDAMDAKDDLCDMTGTDQFISVHRLNFKDEPHEGWHDLESIFWIMAFLILRHTRTNWKALDVVNVLDGGSGERRAFYLKDVHRVKIESNPALTSILRVLAELVEEHTRAMEELATITRRRQSTEDLPNLPVRKPPPSQSENQETMTKNHLVLKHPEFTSAFEVRIAIIESWPTENDEAQEWKMVDTTGSVVRKRSSKASGSGSRRRKTRRGDQQTIIEYDDANEDEGGDIDEDEGEDEDEDEGDGEDYYPSKRQRV